MANFAATKSFLIVEVKPITHHSLSLLYRGATNRQVHATVVAALGQPVQPVAIGKPTHILQPVGDLTVAIQLAIAVALLAPAAIALAIAAAANGAGPGEHCRGSQRKHSCLTHIPQVQIR